MTGLKIIAALIFAIWFALVLMGKGGFVHLLLLNAIGIASVVVMTSVRTRMSAEPSANSSDGLGI
jgi:hypothetical protein